MLREVSQVKILTQPLSSMEDVLNKYLKNQLFTDFGYGVKIKGIKLSEPFRYVSDLHVMAMITVLSSVECN